MEDRSPKGLRSSYAQGVSGRSTSLSPQRSRAPQTDDEFAATLAGDRVFIAAQVTLFVKLMLTVLILDPQSQDTFSLPKSVVGHATSLVLGALLLWLFARYGRRLLLWSPSHVAAGALLVAFAVATPFALDRTVAVFGIFRRYLGLTQMIDNVVLYLAAGILIRDLRSLRLLGLVVFGTAVPVLLYALVQRLGLDPLKFNVSTLIPITFIGNPDIAGAYLAMIGVSALGIAFLLYERLTRPYVVGLVLIGIACVAGMYATGVRGGYLALATGWLAILVLAFRMSSVDRRRRYGLVAVGVVVGLAVLVTPLGGRLKMDRLLNDPGLLSRVEMWEVAGKAVAARPVLGIGPDNFGAFYAANRAERSVAINGGELQNSTHDVWLYMATSAGLIGLAAFVLFVALLIERAIRMAARGQLAALALIPLLAYLGQSLVGVNEVVVDWVFWLSAGLIASAGAEAVRRPRTGWRMPRGARPLGIVAIASAVAVVVVMLPGRILASEALLRTESFNAANRSAEAIGFGQDAISADPRRAETWSSYGAALTNAGSLTAAIAAFESAATRQPWQPQNWKNLMIVWQQLGNRGASLSSAERVLRTDPFDGDAHEFIANLAYDAGDNARAAAEGDLAIKYRLPPQISTYFITASAYIRLKDFPKAESIVRAGIAAYPTEELLKVQLAAILADRGDKAGALAIVDAVLAGNPSNVDAQRLRQALTAK